MARATRANFLVDTALHSLLLTKLFGVEFPDNHELMNISSDTQTVPVDTQVSSTVLAESSEVSDTALAESSDVSDTTLAESLEVSDTTLAESSEVSDTALAESSDVSDTALAESSEVSDTALAESSEITPIRGDENELLKAAAVLYDKLLKKDITIQEVCNDPNVTQLLEELANTKSSLKCFKTAALWIQYLDI